MNDEKSELENPVACRHPKQMWWGLEKLLQRSCKMASCVEEVTSPCAQEEGQGKRKEEEEL